MLGATGSIGISTLDIIERHPDRYQVFALTGHKNSVVMADLIVRFSPEVVVMSDAATCLELEALTSLTGVTCLYGPEALEQVARANEVDIVMAGIVGAAGLRPTLAAVKASKRVLLANKEALVTAGQLFMDAVNKHKAMLLPVDSEHNAIFQCLPPQFDFANPKQGINKIILTASGGPFRSWSLEALKSVTPAQACAHPNWDMGQKISVDSASLMNKGLELIEACWLFGVAADKIDIVVHPQSIIHSMVQYSDGSVLAQMGQPDMRTPIANALAWPDRIVSGVAPLDFTTLSNLEFEAPDEKRFANLRLAREAFTAGHSAPIILNAANEIAVAAFLKGAIGFLDIAALNEALLDIVPSSTADSIDDVLAVDAEARAAAETWVRRSQGAML